MTTRTGRTAPVAVITGTSSGLGEAAACAFLAAGFVVHGLSRSDSGRITDPAFHHHSLDVRDDAAIRTTVRQIAAASGTIDALVNNAGYSLVGAVEDTSDTEALAQIDVNLMGAWRMTRAVLPIMRAQGSGRILTIGSIGGSVGLPFQAAYSASKFALAGFTEALSAELSGSGIDVVLIEPGNFDTPIGASRRRVKNASPASPYAMRFERALTVIERDERRGQSPEILARTLVRAATMRRPARVYRVGPLFERLAPLAKALLPGRLFERLLVRLYR